MAQSKSKAKTKARTTKKKTDKQRVARFRRIFQGFLHHVGALNTYFGRVYFVPYWDEAEKSSCQPELKTGQKVAEITTTHPYRGYSIKLLRSWYDKASDSDVRTTALHEFAHLLITPLAHISRAGGGAYEDAEEDFCDKFALIVGNLWPRYGFDPEGGTVLYSKPRR